MPFVKVVFFKCKMKVVPPPAKLAVGGTAQKPFLGLARHRKRLREEIGFVRLEQRKLCFALQSTCIWQATLEETAAE